MSYKILFITYTHSNGGGAENLLTNLVNNLNCDLYNVDIIEIQEFAVKREPIRDEITLLRPFIKHNSVWTEKAIMYILYHRPEIIKYLFRLYNYDIIITWNYQLPSFCLRSFEKEIKIAWFHGDIYNLANDETDTKISFLRDLQFRAWSVSDKIVTISGKSLQSLKDVLPSLYDKSTIISNRTDIAKIRQLSLDTTTLNFPFSFENNIIISVGRLDENKNFQLLIRAVSKLIHSGIDCRLLLLGKGELQNELETLVKEEKIVPYVYFAGYQENPYPYMKRSKVVCITSLCEGFGLVALEAMILGKPFVTTPVAGASEELADNQKCGLVSDWNVDEYSACIKRLLIDDALYTDMSENCLIMAQEYSIDKYVKKFENLIDEILQIHPIDQSQESRNYYAEFKAMIYFSLSFAVLSHLPLSDNNLQAAYQRLKKTPNTINIIKFFYRLSCCILHFFIAPIAFVISFIQYVNIRRH